MNEVVAASDLTVAPGLQPLQGQVQKAASALMAQEGVLVFRITQVRDALGDRWPHKRRHVWEFVDRFARKILEPTDVFMRVNEVEYLLSCPGRGEGTAEAVAFRIAEQTVGFFLGEPSPDYEVLSLKMAREGQGPAQVVAEQVAAPEPLSGPTQFKGYAWRLVPIRTIRGRELEIRCRCVEVIPLSGSAESSLKVDVQIFDDIVGEILDSSERLTLDPEDHLRIDGVGLEYAAALVRSRPERHSRSSVMVEVSIRTAALQTRSRMQIALSGVHPRIRRALKLELVDITPDTPPGRVAEVAASLQSQVEEVIPRVSGHRTALRSLEGRRWPAVSMLGSEARKAASNPAALEAFCRDLDAVATSLIVHDDGFEDIGLWLCMGATRLSGHELQEIFDLRTAENLRASGV
jgi:hypothetical protein